MDYGSYKDMMDGLSWWSFDDDIELELYDHLIPIGNPGFNILKSNIDRFKRIGTTQIRIDKSYFIMIDSNMYSQFISFGRRRDQEWLQPDFGKVLEVQIGEFDDGWFFVKIYPCDWSGKVKYHGYLCDQIEGVIDLLRDYGILHNDVRKLELEHLKTFEGYIDQYYFEIDNDEHHSMWGQSGVRMGANQTDMTDRERKIVQMVLGKKVKWEFDSKTLAGKHSIKIFGKDFDWIINKVRDDWYVVSKLIMRPSFRVRNWKCDQIEGLVRFLEEVVLKSGEQPELFSSD